MFGTMHQEGYTPPGGTYVHPPYHSKREIWDAVFQKAEQGPVAQIGSPAQQRERAAGIFLSNNYGETH